LIDFGYDETEMSSSTTPEKLLLNLQFSMVAFKIRFRKNVLSKKTPLQFKNYIPLGINT